MSRTMKYKFQFVASGMFSIELHWDTSIILNVKGKDVEFNDLSIHFYKAEGENYQIN